LSAALVANLAGHRELGMTLRYMHLVQLRWTVAIRLLDQRLVLQKFGELGERGGALMKRSMARTT
jgi:hypothetical protein